MNKSTLDRLAPLADELPFYGTMGNTRGFAGMSADAFLTTCARHGIRTDQGP